MTRCTERVAGRVLRLGGSTEKCRPRAPLTADMLGRSGRTPSFQQPYIAPPKCIAGRLLVDAPRKTRSLSSVMTLTKRSAERTMAIPATAALPFELIVGLVLLALIIGRAGTGAL